MEAIPFGLPGASETAWAFFLVLKQTSVAETVPLTWTNHWSLTAPKRRELNRDGKFPPWQEGSEDALNAFVAVFPF